MRKVEFASNGFHPTLEYLAMRRQTCLRKREVFFLLQPLLNSLRPKYFLFTRLKQIPLGKILPHMIGMPGTVLVCLYSPYAQDPLRLHWPGCVVDTLKA
ncbi:hypothetical protein AVEN_253007-1 [Araneus ventricosus]|uniref:Uncharacterized protein n=1 Tax=Araneus ventricosus TaxID=182803 RepID=A0A4Y2EYG2_ARAVE|nr:hypothetical protein AVEN_253007-1 [Araneus ventricosus]